MAFLAPAVNSFVPTSSAFSMICSNAHVLQHPTRTALSMALPLKDFSGAALAFFNNVRVPAALIAGANLSSLFSFVKLVNAEKKASRLQNWMVQLFHFLCFNSLLSSISVIVTSTAASTTLMLGDHNGMAESAYDFLNREMRYEFVTTRWSFMLSNLMFIAGIATRAILEFDLMQPKRRRLALIMVLLMTSLVTHLLSFVNSTLHCWNSLFDMTWDVIKLVISRALGRGTPLALMSVISFFGALLIALPLFKFDRTNAWISAPDGIGKANTSILANSHKHQVEQVLDESDQETLLEEDLSEPSES